MEQLRQPLLRECWQGIVEEKNVSPAAVDVRFLKRFWRLLRISRCLDCFWLVLLSIISVVITSRAGLIVGHFYNALISKNMKASSQPETEKLFVATIGQSLLWYGAESVCNATELWVAEYLAIGWRLNLTQAGHSMYCSRSSLSAISQGQVPDNPDERLTNEMSRFCQALAQLMMKVIATPLLILYYTWWVWYHVGWVGPVIIYAFFFVGVSVTHLIITPIAALVARQEKLEADFRVSHIRFRANAEEIGMYGSLGCERNELEKDLKAALANRKSLVSWHFVLKFSSQAYDYLGGIMTYCVVAIPVFGGLIDTEGSGELANLISNSSFAVLQLIYGFSQLIDSANLVSDVAGHCARIGELFEFLDALPLDEGTSWSSSGLNFEESKGTKTSHTWFSCGSTSPSMVGPEQSLREGNLICPCTSLKTMNGITLNMSVGLAPVSVSEEVFSRFPEGSSSSPVVVSTLQLVTSWTNDSGLSNLDISGNPLESVRLKHSQSVQEEKLFTEVIVRSIQGLALHGYWAVAVNTLTGSQIYPFMDTSGKGAVDAAISTDVGWSRSRVGLFLKKQLSDSVSMVSEVAPWFKDSDTGAIFSAQQAKGCPFTVSLFTLAPIAILHKIVLGWSSDISLPGNQRCISPDSDQPDLQTFLFLPALAIHNLTVVAPNAFNPVIKNFTMELEWGETLLITGAMGSGKTSLIRVLCGLWPLQRGEIRSPIKISEMGSLVLPQNPVLAKAGLAGQIAYPDSLTCPLHGTVPRLKNALEAVDMLYLLTTVKGDWAFEGKWIETLSPGEKQLLSLARVFYHRPQLVILDEATSALSESTEDVVYERLLALGVTIISVAHRSRLRRFHSRVLELKDDGDGSWSFD